MDEKYPGLEQWDVEIDEKSAGCYEIRGRHPDGPTLSATGTNPEELIKWAQQTARTMMQSVAERRKHLEQSNPPRSN